MSDWVSIDGEVMPANQGLVPIYDRGFLYGDSVFETMRTYGGQLHALQLHLDRLRLSASRIAMDLGFSEERIRRDLKGLLAKRPDEESYLRLIITRGDGEFGLAPDLAGAQRLVILARPLPDRSESFWRLGVKAISLEEAGRSRGRRIAKTGNYLTNLLALDSARRAGAHEALRFDADDQLTEGSTSNVFMVHEGTLYTPDLAAGVLPGITRQQVIECAHQLNIPVVEGPIRRELLDQATELMISSSLRELVAVVMLDEEPIGDGLPGPICQRLHTAYREQCVDRL